MNSHTTLLNGALEKLEHLQRGITQEFGTILGQDLANFLSRVGEAKTIPVGKY